MKQTWTKLRTATLAVAFLGSLGFGATQAFGSAASSPWYKYCPATGYDYPYTICAYGCEVGRGYCTWDGRCACGDLP
jgi:hypothetical protein